MKIQIRNVRSKGIEFEVDHEHAPKLGTEVGLAISMGDATVKRTYKVTRIETRGGVSIESQRVTVKAEGDGVDG